jgi:uncharacterized protein YceH (UPF0502 family)
LHHFEELSDVQAALQKLMAREPALVKVLARQPGTKESRYVHLMSGDVEDSTTDGMRDTVHASPAGQPEDSGRIARLEREVAELREQFAQFRKQLE